MQAALDTEAAEGLVRALMLAGTGAQLRVTGGCLAPQLEVGERVRLAPVGARPPRFGDVVLARLPAGLRLHRLIWPLPGLPARALRTKADRAPFADPAVTKASILATVVGVERGQAVVPARSALCAARSLAAAIAVRIGVACGWRPD